MPARDRVAAHLRRQGVCEMASDTLPCSMYYNTTNDCSATVFERKYCGVLSKNGWRIGDVESREYPPKPQRSGHKLPEV
jgi:hypothetical protein